MDEEDANKLNTTGLCSGDSLAFLSSQLSRPPRDKRMPQFTDERDSSRLVVHAGSGVSPGRIIPYRGFHLVLNTLQSQRKRVAHGNTDFHDARLPSETGRHTR